MSQNRQIIDFFGLSIESNEIIDFLRKNLELKEVCLNILYQRIIEQVAQNQGLSVTPEEIQMEVSRLLRQRSLTTNSDILAWLAEQLVAVESWQAGIRDRLLNQKLAEYLFTQEVEKFFAQNRTYFEQLLIYQIVVPNEEIAREVLYLIAENEVSFYEAAHLYNLDAERRYQCGYLGRLYRWNLPPEIATVVLNAIPGQVIGPIQTEVGQQLLMLEEFIPAQLTPQRYRDILQQLFQQWLDIELNYLLESNKH